MSILGSVRTGNRWLKSSPVHTISEKFENKTITGHFGFVFRGKSRDYRDVIVIEKLRFQTVFRPRENAKSAFPNFSSLKKVFKKLRFRDGLVWTESLTVEIQLCFQIFPV